MKYDGKNVIKLYGKIKAGQGSVFIQFADGSTQQVSLKVFRNVIKKGD